MPASKHYQLKPSTFLHEEYLDKWSMSRMMQNSIIVLPFRFKCCSAISNSHWMWPGFRDEITRIWLFQDENKFIFNFIRRLTPWKIRLNFSVFSPNVIRSCKVRRNVRLEFIGSRNLFQTSMIFFLTFVQQKEMSDIHDRMDEAQQIFRKTQSKSKDNWTKWKSNEVVSTLTVSNRSTSSNIDWIHWMIERIEELSDTLHSRTVQQDDKFELFHRSKTKNECDKYKHPIAFFSVRAATQAVFVLW